MFVEWSKGIVDLSVVFTCKVKVWWGGVLHRLNCDGKVRLYRVT